MSDDGGSQTQLTAHTHSCCASFDVRAYVNFTAEAFTAAVICALRLLTKYEYGDGRYMTARTGDHEDDPMALPCQEPHTG